MAAVLLLIIAGISAISSAPRAEAELQRFDNSTWWGEPEPLTSAPLFEEGGGRRREAPRDVRLDHDARMYLLQLHNIYRGNVTPPAGDMSYMEWDDELADLAQAWAEACMFEHGMPNNSYPETIGQNLYIGTDSSGRLGLWMWYDEYRHYDLRRQTCMPGRQCGHYVQMAWAPSNRLGCAMNRCGMRYYLVCHYSYQSLKGAQMYRVGDPCSQCPAESLCLKNLCVSQEQCRRKPFECQFAECRLECRNCGRLDEDSCRCDCAGGWDSPDCSRRCEDKHDRCGKSPGWPNKAACSLMRHAVAETYCRKMCEMCSTLDKTSNETCCQGKVCDEGYVLNTDTCRCSLLCPGPVCDHANKVQASQQSSSPHSPLLSWSIVFLAVSALHELSRDGASAFI